MHGWTRSTRRTTATRAGRWQVLQPPMLTTAEALNARWQAAPPTRRRQRVGGVRRGAGSGRRALRPDARPRPRRCCRWRARCMRAAARSTPRSRCRSTCATRSRRPRAERDAARASRRGGRRAVSALLAPARRPSAGTLLPMTAARLDAVMAIETAVYAFPWSRGNFIDSLAAGYDATVLLRAPTANCSATSSRWTASTRCTCSTSPSPRRSGAAVTRAS